MKSIIRIALIVSAVGALKADEPTRASLLQTTVIPYLVSQDTQNEYTSVVDLIAHSVNAPVGGVTANGLVLWASADGEQVANSGVSIDASDNMSGILLLTATTVEANELLGSVFGKGVNAVVVATENVESATSSAIPSTIIRRDVDGSFKVEQLFLSDVAPIGEDSLATKGYVDTSATGLIEYGGPVKAVATENVTLLGGTGVIVDGVSLDLGNAVLLTGQTNPVDNGVWIVSSGSWDRTTIEPLASGNNAWGAYIPVVSEGTLYRGTSWACTVTEYALVSTNTLYFAQFSLKSQVTGANVVGSMWPVFWETRDNKIYLSTINGTGAIGTAVSITQDDNNIIVSANGPISLPDGTSGSCAIQFRDDLNTGLRYGSGQIRLVANGDTQATIAGSVTTITNDLRLVEGITYAETAKVIRNVEVTAGTSYGSPLQEGYQIPLTTVSNPAIYFRNTDSYYDNRQLRGTDAAVGSAIRKQVTVTGPNIADLDLLFCNASGTDFQTIANIEGANVLVYWVPGVAKTAPVFVYREARF